MGSVIFKFSGNLKFPRGNLVMSGILRNLTDLKIIEGIFDLIFALSYFEVAKNLLYLIIEGSLII